MNDDERARFLDAPTRSSAYSTWPPCCAPRKAGIQNHVSLPRPRSGSAGVVAATGTLTLRRPGKGRAARRAVRSPAYVGGPAHRQGRSASNVARHRGRRATRRHARGSGCGTELAVAAGFPLGESGGLVTDLRMRVPGHEGVWAAGTASRSSTECRSGGCTSRSAPMRTAQPGGRHESRWRLRQCVERFRLATASGSERPSSRAATCPGTVDGRRPVTDISRCCARSSPRCRPGRPATRGG